MPSQEQSRPQRREDAPDETPEPTPARFVDRGVDVGVGQAREAVPETVLVVVHGPDAPGGDQGGPEADGEARPFAGDEHDTSTRRGSTEEVRERTTESDDAGPAVDPDGARRDRVDQRVSDWGAHPSILLRGGGP